MNGQNKNNKNTRPPQTAPNATRPSSAPSRNTPNKKPPIPDKNLKSGSRTPVRRPQNTRPSVKKSYKRKKTKAGKQRSAAVLVLFLTWFLLISLLFSGFIYFSFNKQSNNAEIYSLQLLYDKKKVATFDSTQVNNNYGLYVPYTSLTKICGISIAGDSKDVVILIGPDGGTIRCTNNSTLIYVNDNAMHISCPVLFTDNDYLIPVELVDIYIIGLDVAYNKEKKLCTISSGADMAVTLKMQLPTELEKVSFPTESSDTTSDTSDMSGTSDISRNTSRG